MKNCVLFLHGTYRTTDLGFYRKLCRGCIRIAVDGGYSFFKKTGMVPDLLIGDLDSLKRKPTGLSSRTRVITFPVEKDATDAELALDYCLDHKARRIDIVQPSIGEFDHLAGNFTLLTKTLRPKFRISRPRVRLITPSEEVFVRDTGSWSISDAVGDLVSILPISKRVILSCKGTAFDVSRLTIRRGETVGLRNRILSKRARFEIEGQAFVFHRAKQR